MPEVIAWQCPRSGRLFETKESYVEYLREIAYASRAKLKPKAKREAYTKWKDLCVDFRKCASFDDISWWLGQNLLDLVGNSPTNVKEYGIYCRPPYVMSNGIVEIVNDEWAFKLTKVDGECLPGWWFDVVISSDDLTRHGVENGGVRHPRRGIVMHGNDFFELYDSVLCDLGIRSDSGSYRSAENSTISFRCKATVVKFPLMQIRDVLATEGALRERYQ